MKWNPGLGGGFALDFAALHPGYGMVGWGFGWCYGLFWLLDLVLGFVLATLHSMNTITFDTLKFVERLVESGMPERQAKALAQAQAEINEANLEDLATKGDLFELKADLREMDAKINGRLNLLTWMLALVVIASVVPALKMLLK